MCCRYCYDHDVGCRYWFDDVSTLLLLHNKIIKSFSLINLRTMQFGFTIKLLAINITIPIQVEHTKCDFKVSFGCCKNKKIGFMNKTMKFK